MTSASPLILLSDDDKSIRLVASKALANAGFQVKTAETLEGLMALIDHHDASVLVSDVVYPDGDALDVLPQIKISRPDLNIIMMSARSTLLTAVKAQEGEVFAYLPKPFPLEALVETVTAALAASPKLAANPPVAAEDALGDGDQSQIVGTSPAMQDIFRSMARLVPTDLSVMITGESGTGKEVVARALHDLGRRRDGPFVALNMAAIPRDLIESELFGHEKGAFTGADRRLDGRFAQAKTGTLFLDEIGDMPPDAQTRLLRVLQDGGYTRVGGREVIRSDARIIAATHQSLPELIQKGQFREDLYYRLNVVPLNLPPLRERPDDIPDLVRHFMARAAGEGLSPKSIAPDAMALLKSSPWPGNVRELENLIRRVLVLVDDGVITSKHLSSLLASGGEHTPGGEIADADNLSEAAALHIERFFASHNGNLPAPGLYGRILEEVERPLITATLQATGGNQIKAAEVLGLNRNTLRKKIQLLGISPTVSRFKRRP
ncbi:MAG: nitrogen regulation protein NR(I) [Alphaproteobacteria bacterium]|nr:nitrogen regulation protein NR(I) [Alphaproteobacteria bacterium]